MISNLESGNVAYKLMRELGDVPAVGPVPLGMPRAVSVLERDCSVDIVLMSASPWSTRRAATDGRRRENTMQANFEVLGTGVCLPPKIVTNADLEARVNTHEWIVERNWIHERRTPRRRLHVRPHRSGGAAPMKTRTSRCPTSTRSSSRPRRLTRCSPRPRAGQHRLGSRVPPRSTWRRAVRGGSTPQLGPARAGASPPRP